MIYSNLLRRSLFVPTCGVFLNPDLKKPIQASGTAQSSFVQRYLDGHNLTPEQQKTVKWAATMLPLGGTDSICPFFHSSLPSLLTFHLVLQAISVAHTFILCMLLNPAAQKKAQAELDAILGLGPERLLTTADRAKLPYAEACWKESLRRDMIVPEGLAHMVRDDVVYEGYHIPKGTFVMRNI
jgi:hypothetical protein